MARRLQILLLILFPALTQGQGIHFEDVPWKKALERAGREHKLVFLDAYTSWCGPCKMMSRQVFTNDTVGALFNERFVNVKFDMEKGEGADLATRYNVYFYPTLLFLDSTGAVVHRAVGLQSVPEFTALGQAALTPDQNLRDFNNRFNRGDRQAGFLLQYTRALAAANDPAADLMAAEYLKIQQDWSLDGPMEVILRYVTDPFAPGFRYLARNPKKFEQKFGADQVAQRKQFVYNEYLQNHPDLPLGEIQHLIGAVYPDDSGRIASAYSLDYHRQRSDIPNFVRTAIIHYDRYPSTNADELNEVAWLFYLNVSDRDQLRQALKWAKKSVSIQEKYQNNDTLAALYFKLGKKKAAARHARRAIELAKQAGDDYSPTEELLQKINQL